MPTSPTLDQLRAEIERKYREAIAAFEILRAYVSAPENQEGSQRESESPSAGRHDLSQDELLARAYAGELETRKRARKNRTQTQPQGKAADVVAKANGVSAATVKRAVKSQRERIATDQQNGDGHNEFRPGQAR